MIWCGCPWPLPKCWPHEDDWLIWVTLSFLSSWKANSKSKEICTKIQLILMTWRCGGKDEICTSSTPTPQGGTPSNRLHGRLYPKKGIGVSEKGRRCADLGNVKGAALFMDGISDCLVPSNQQKVYQGACILTSCGGLPLWNYPWIVPDVSWVGEEWLVGCDKHPKSQYGSVRLKII